MENASKALLMAGGILVGILVLSIAVYLFASYRDIGIAYEQSLSAVEIDKFNSNFTKFEGRDDITIQEIVSTVNFAKQYEEQTGTRVKVCINRNELNDKKPMELIKLIENNSSTDEGEIKYFKCGLNENPEEKDIEYDENGFVKLIRFN